MQKFSRIINIIVCFILTLTGLIKLMPAQSHLALLLNKIFQQTRNNLVTNNVISMLLLILGGAIFISILYDLKTEQKRHSFKVGSYLFCTFFKKWYSQPGLLSIICDDLEGWVNPNNNNLIINALREKSQAKELYLFLGKESPQEIINELRQLGAVIEHAPLEIITNYSFSCLSVMGNHSAVIVRNKQQDKSTRIVFEEISNSYISGLLNTIIKEGTMNGQKGNKN